MTSISKPIVFFGTEDFSLTTLRSLVAAGYTIVAVVTKPDSKRGRDQKLTPPSVKLFAQAQNIPVWQPTKLSEITSDIQSLGDVAGVLVSYGKIIPQSIINLFSPGIINLHPSLLPLYRGPSPIESAIKNGDTKTGVSIMKLSAAMDAGPVFVQTIYPLVRTETRTDLYRTLAATGTATLLTVLPAILEGSLQPTPQDDTAATYCQLLDKKDSMLHPQKLTAIQAERLVRAHLGFPKTKINVFGHDIVITKAHVSTESKTPLDIVCQDGAFLSVDELIAPSGRRMSAQAFINGYAVG
ncbi:methionyl-tRNA formyltransferase [Candidatus Saccharibacteria bacterium]|nr:methionyl-tRNA formyltransferase [Candidatus Saccharibacteria bacterium]